jgi:putative DNA methylase
MRQALIAVIAEGKNGRIFLDPNADQVSNATAARPTWRPDAQLPNNPRDFKTPNYGMPSFGDLFTDRQLVGLNTFTDLVNEVRSKIEADAVEAGMAEDRVSLNELGLGAKSYAEAISVYLGFVVSSQVDRMSTVCTWDAGGPTWGTKTRNTFARQAIPMTWDFAEANPFSTQSGSFHNSLDYTSKGVVSNAASIGRIVQLDARHLDSDDRFVISTDPPYYDNIGYADLSDFFYVWLRRSLRDVFPDVCASLATPKFDELVATPYRYGGQAEAEDHFMKGMRSAVSRMVENSRDDFPATVYYAFKQKEVAEEGISSTGWATFLQAIVESGFAVVGTWPMRTELANRMIASGNNALANSVVLVCRKKEASAEVITRAEFIRALKRELPPAIAELQAANIAPADMPQSAIGPGMGVFSRYKAVLESDDSPMTVKAALQLINRELDEYLGGIQGEFDADTRFAITWFEQNGLKAGDYGTANNIATARGISVESVKHAGIVESAAGKVRILKRDEMDAEWEPDADGHLTVWECCQHLVRLHEKYGIGYEAAVMLKKFGPKADDVRDLAYVLYNICEKRGDAKEATAYNALIADWTDLTREAATAPLTNRSGQMRFEV